MHTKLLNILAASAAASLCGGLAGCAPENAAAPTATAAIDVNWSLYPRQESMRLATLQCQLQPKTTLELHSPLIGLLHVYVTAPQTNLPAGMVWAEFEPEVLASEQATLERARDKLEMREKLQLEMELPKEKLRLSQAIDEAERQLKLLELFSTNRELAASSLRLSSINPLQPAALDRARTELRLLQYEMEFLKQTNLVVLGVDLPGQWAEWERRKFEFERRRSHAQLKMPFDGQLTVNLPLSPDIRQYPVEAGNPIAVVRDLSLIRVRVVLSNPAWANLPPESLTAVVRLPTGEPLRAKYAFNKIERMQNRDESVYYFEFSPEHALRASKLLGTDIGCEIWYHLSQPSHVVPKLTLVMSRPDAFRGGGWAQGVAAAWGGAHVLMEGQTELAILLPSDRAQ